jgi:hypothetical protein
MKNKEKINLFGASGVARVTKLVGQYSRFLNL